MSSAVAGGPGRLLRLRNGVEMPRIGLGTFRVKGDDVAVAVRTALHDSGLRCIDTASIYKNETELGAVLRSSGISRSDLFVTSKLSPYEHGAVKAQSACEAILDRLGLDYVDMLLIHWPGVAKKPLASPENKRMRQETWQVLESMYEQGRCRAIGVSNYELRHLEELCASAAVLPMVNQVECHPHYPQTALRRRCSELGVAVVAYSSLGQGELLQNQVVMDVAAAHGKTAAQVLLRWGLQSDCCVLPKSVTPDRILQFSEAELLSWEIDDAGMQRLNALGETPVKYCWDPADVM